MRDKTVEKLAGDKSRAQIAAELDERVRDEALIVAGALYGQVAKHPARGPIVAAERTTGDGEKLLLARKLIVVASGGAQANTPGWTPPKPSNP